MGRERGDVDAAAATCCFAWVPSIFRSVTVAALVCLTAIACQKADSTNTAQSPQDDALRAYLGIRSLRGTYTLPASAKGYYPVALIFQNGEEVGRTVGVMIGLGQNSKEISGDLQLLLSAKDRRAMLYHNGNSAELGDKIDWTQFGGTTTWSAIPVAQEIRYQDVSVRAVFATAPGPAITPSIRLDNEFTKSGPYVVAIGVVSGDDIDALRKKFLSESGDRPPGRGKAEVKPN